MTIILQLKRKGDFIHAKLMTKTLHKEKSGQIFQNGREKYLVRNKNSTIYRELKTI